METQEQVSDTPLYGTMIEAIDLCVAAGHEVDTATIGDIETLIRIANDHGPELKLIQIRKRADREVRKAFRAQRGEAKRARA
jgi:hypothetical protein